MPQTVSVSELTDIIARIFVHHGVSEDNVPPLAATVAAAECDRSGAAFSLRWDRGCRLLVGAIVVRCHTLPSFGKSPYRVKTIRWLMPKPRRVNTGSPQDKHYLSEIRWRRRRARKRHFTQQ
jgi:hypothetical protein